MEYWSQDLEILHWKWKLLYFLAFVERHEVNGFSQSIIKKYLQIILFDKKTSTFLWTKCLVNLNEIFLKIGRSQMLWIFY
jgi:hypothetical protein